MTFEIQAGKCKFCGKPAVKESQAIFDAAVEFIKANSETGFKIYDALKKRGQKIKIHIATGSGDNKLWHDADLKNVFPEDHICWNPLRQVQAKAGLQSPVVGLIHELGHATQALTTQEFYQARAVPGGTDGEYEGKAIQVPGAGGKWKITNSIVGKDIERSPDAWIHDIETNNITKHEIPVVRELKAKGFKDVERAKQKCKKPTGIPECVYCDGDNSIDMSMTGTAPDKETAGPHRGKKVSEMTWAERISCAVFCKG
jgi:hypothetical protein